MVRQTTTPLPQLIYPRAIHLRRRLKELIYSPLEQGQIKTFVGPIIRTEDFISVDQAILDAAEEESSYESISVGDCFSPASTECEEGGKEFPWTQRWFLIDITIPFLKEDDERDVYMEFLAHGEFTVYTENGDAWCGIDPCHSHILLSPLLQNKEGSGEKTCRLWLDGGQWQTGFWFGLKPPTEELGFRLQKTQLQQKNEVAYQTYHDLSMLIEWVEYTMTEVENIPLNTENGFYEPFVSVSPTLRRMLYLLNQACDVYDRTLSLPDLQTKLQSIYSQMTSTNEEFFQSKVCLVGHAHLDLVWLWPEKVTYQKAIHTYSNVLQLMEKYPQKKFVFTMSQPPLFYHIQKQQPKLAYRIKEYIQNGQWEFTGALEVEADTQIPVGEGLIRCILYGQERIKAVKGSYSDTLWIPDVFGYTQCLPQLLSLAEIPYFFTTKILWSTITKFPHNSFIWKSPDQSSVLAHLSVAGYNGKVSLKELMKATRQYQQGDVHNEVLCPSGYGDGGGGPTEDQIERSLRLQKSLGGTTPSCSWDTVGSFFERLSNVQEDLPVYQGELFLEYHRAVHSTQSNFKKHLRSCERSLQVREAMRVISGNYNPLDMAENWERYLFALFHDATPGSSIHSVYQDLNQELDSLSNNQMQMTINEWPKTVATATALNDRNIVIANPLAWKRYCIVELPEQLCIVYDQDAVYCCVFDYLQSFIDGIEYPTQVHEDTIYACVPLDGLTAQSFHLTDDKNICTEADTNATITEVFHSIEASPTCLDNGIVCVTFDEYGQVDSMRVHGEPVLLEGTASFTIHADHPEAYDAWDMDHHIVWMKESAIKEPVTLKVLTCGPVLAVLQSSPIEIGKNKSTMVLQYKLCSCQEVLDISCIVDWKENHSTLRYQVPTKYMGQMARFGAPFSFVDRSQIPQGPTEEAQWEVPASRWASVMNGSMTDGLSIITEAKYGFRAKQGTLSFTLLRSPTYPDPTADLGHHTIQWSLSRHSSNFENIVNNSYEFNSSSTAAKADELYTPFVMLAEPLSQVILTPPIQFMSLNSVVPSWVMPSESPYEQKRGFCIRLHEISGCHTSITFIIPKLISQNPTVHTVNLRNAVQSTLTPNEDGQYHLPIAAYKIVTLRVLI